MTSGGDSYRKRMQWKVVSPSGLEKGIVCPNSGSRVTGRGKRPERQGKS